MSQRDSTPTPLERALAFRKIDAADASADDSNFAAIPIGGLTYAHRHTFVDGAAYENARLAPLHSALVAVVRAAEAYGRGDSALTDALRALDAVVGGDDAT